MYSLIITADHDVLDAYHDQFVKFPRLLQTAFDRQSRRIRSELTTALHTEPGSIPDLPFVWSHDPMKQARARRYYFGVILKGKKRKGGRYTRTHQLVNSWKVTYNARTGDGEITARNNASGFDYVIGNRQVPSHQMNDWYVADDVFMVYQDKLTQTLIDVFFTVTDPFAGVP